MKYNIFLVPTENESDIFLKAKSGELEYNLIHPFYGIRNLGWTYQHLYITSDEQIKEGDWICYNEKEIYMFEKANDSRAYDVVNSLRDRYRKIIGTTNNKLWHKSIERISKFSNWIAPLIPKIPQSLIEEYITRYNCNFIITDIELEEEEVTGGELTMGDWDKKTTRLKLNEQGEVIPKKKANSKTFNRMEVLSAIKEYCSGRPEYEPNHLNKWFNENFPE